VHDLERDAQVAAEQERILHVDDVVVVALVLAAEQVEDLDLRLRLLVEAALVADDLEGDVRLGFVVVGFDHVAERSLAEPLEDFVPVADVVIFDALVPALVVVKAKVLALGLVALDLPGRGPDKVDAGVLFNLLLLVRREDAAVLCQRFSRGQGAVFVRRPWYVALGGLLCRRCRAPRLCGVPVPAP
jgi:hypothetical protein